MEATFDRRLTDLEKEFHSVNASWESRFAVAFTNIEHLTNEVQELSNQCKITQEQMSQLVAKLDSLPNNYLTKGEFIRYLVVAVAPLVGATAGTILMMMLR